MGPLRRRSFICCQACVFHISAGRPTPMTVTSFSSFACWRRLAGSRMRPACPATPPRRWRTESAARHGFHHAFFGQKCGNALHSSSGNATRQSSSQRVTMKVPAHGLAEFGREIEPPLVVDGIAVLADQHFQPPSSRHMGEFPHFYPLCPTSVSIIRGVPVKINPFSVKVFDAEPFLTVSKHVSGRIFFGNRSVSPHGRAKGHVGGRFAGVQTDKQQKRRAPEKVPAPACRKR